MSSIIYQRKCQDILYIQRTWIIFWNFCLSFVFIGVYARVHVCVCTGLHLNCIIVGCSQNSLINCFMEETTIYIFYS